jgi:uncharacterized metal-binding protein YceD (DUF177 family)
MSSAHKTAALFPIGLWRDGTHKIDLSFPAEQCPELVEAGALGTVAVRGKSDSTGSRLWLDLTMTVTVIANCARSLDDFELTYDAPVRLIVLRGLHIPHVEWDYEGEEEFTVSVPETHVELDVGELLRQCLELERPLHTIKPGVDLPDGVEPEDVPLPLLKDDDEETKEEPIDPRWAALKKLRKP